MTDPWQRLWAFLNDRPNHKRGNLITVLAGALLLGLSVPLGQRALDERGHLTVSFYLIALLGVVLLSRLAELLPHGAVRVAAVMRAVGMVASLIAIALALWLLVRPAGF